MRKFKIEISDSAITQKGVQTVIDFYNTIAISRLQFPGVTAFATGLQSPFLNVVIDTRDITHDISELISPIAHFFKDHRSPWTWFLTAISRFNDLDALGFGLLEESPSLYFNLTNEIPDLAQSFVSCEPLSENDNLDKWIEAIHEGFPNADNEAYRKLNVSVTQETNKFKHFVAYHQKEIVASGSLFFSDNAVMLHNIATKHSFRKLGIGTTLTIYMMQLAKKLGYQHCFLDTSEEGFNLYRRLGFQIYCTTLVYQ